MNLEQVQHKGSIQAWSNHQADVDQSEGHFAIREAIKRCVSDSM